MNRLEDFINRNIEAFDSEEVPAGSRERFLMKFREERQSIFRRRAFILTLGSIAASAAIAICMIHMNPMSEVRKQHRRLAMKEAEILTVISTNTPELLNEVMNTIRGVTSEAIPLENQLPDELDDKVRREILREYYMRKYCALEEILNQYTQFY